MTITEGIIIAVLTALGVWVAQGVAIWRFRKEQPMLERKSDAEANATNSEGLEHYANATKVLLEPLTKRVADLEAERMEKQEYYDILEKEWREQRALLQERILHLEARQIVLEADIVSLRNENAALRADKIVYENQISEFKLQIGNLQRELEEYKR